MGDTVSFYSFKGGTGRSTCLSNVAFELAKRGSTVGCMDFDLSAPGLHMIYDIGPTRRNRTKSIHNYLDPQKPRSQDLNDYVLNIKKSYRDTNFEGDLFIMPGDISPNVAAEMAGDSEKTFREIQGLIRKFEREFNLDYIFLDSRSGISNQAMPIFNSADELMVFTKWTHQHKLGTYELLNWIGNTVAGNTDFFNNVITVASNVTNNVTQNNVENWVKQQLPAYVDQETLIHESDILKESEEIVIETAPNKQVTSDYQNVADIIEKI